jgi:hypothetical protein
MLRKLCCEVRVESFRFLYGQRFSSVMAWFLPQAAATFR